MKSIQDFKIGNYIVYDHPNAYWDEGVITECGNDWIQINSINGNNRIFTQSDFKYCFISWK